MPDLIEQRSFVPHDLDPGDWDRLESLYRALLDRELGSVDGLEQWLSDYSELVAVVDEFGCRRYIDHACHTDDEKIVRAWLDFVEQIEPKIKPYDFKLKRQYVACPFIDALEGPRFAVLTREWRADVELFREQNVPLQTEITKLNSEYDKVFGAMTVDFRGETCTLQQLTRFLEQTDRPTRQEAWERSANRRLEDRGKIDDIFERMLKLRVRIAENADQPDYRAYKWRSMKRFDYAPEDCLRFGDAIADAVAPLNDRLNRQRKEALGVASLRPWDTAVDPRGRDPLRPFERDDVDRLMSGCRRVFDGLSAELGERFGRLEPGRNLDLVSRPGKQAGGFQSSLCESGEPFIFMNAAGMHHDVETMLHEAGHAFHFTWSFQREPRYHFRGSPPMEFCEVASMAMELIAMDRLGEFYPDEQDFHRAKREQLEGVIRFFPWMAIIDGYQHWLYTHPGHSLDQRTDAWLALLERFQSTVVDWTGHADARAAMWQRQLHLFHVPFYYVEYGIAQLGALQLWLNYRRDPRRALADYREALSLGGTRPLPELFDAAGIRFDFSRDTLGPLIAAVDAELDRLPQ